MIHWREPCMDVYPMHTDKQSMHCIYVYLMRKHAHTRAHTHTRTHSHTHLLTIIIIKKWYVDSLAWPL